MRPSLTYNVLDTIPGLIMVLDDKGFVLAAFGDGWATIGLRADDLIHENIKAIKTTPFRQRHVDFCLERGDEITIVAPHMERQFECTYKLIADADNSGPTIICTARDKTQEMRVDQNMIESAFELSAMARTRSLEELATAVAHEINNPLAIISGHSNALRMMVEKGALSAESGEQHFTAINRNVDRVIRIIRSLRDIAEDGNNETMKKTSMESIARKAIDQIADKAKSLGISVKLATDPGDSSALIRELQIIHAVEQLLLNGVAAVKEASEKWISVNVTNTDHSVEISVTDAGRGIPKDLHHKIMLPFFTTRQVGEGTGIGLNIAKRNAEANGGVLRLDGDAPNTRFVIALPKQPTADKTKA